MANPEDVREAIDKLHVIQAQWGNPGTRMHETGLLVANTLRSVLEHPCCGECMHLVIKPIRIDGKNSVELNCHMGLSPEKLWRNWYPDQEPVTCPDCTDPMGKPPEIE